MGYLYRTIDRDGKTVDFRLCRRRNVAAAKAFLRKTVRSQVSPSTSITLDGYAASYRAVRELQEQNEPPKTVRPQSSKYLNSKRSVSVQPFHLDGDAFKR